MLVRFWLILFRRKKLLFIAALVAAKQTILSRIVKFPLPLNDWLALFLTNFRITARLILARAFPQFFGLEAAYASFCMVGTLLGPLLLFLALLKAVISYRLFRFQ